MTIQAHDVAALKDLGFEETTYDGQEGTFMVHSVRVVQKDTNVHAVTEILPDGRIQRAMIGEDEEGVLDTAAYCEGPFSIFSPEGQYLLSRKDDWHF